MKVKITTQENMAYYNCAKNTIIDIPIEDYVAAVVASEMGSRFVEANRAQAVAARTFAVNRGILEGKAISDDASVAQAFRASRLYDSAGQIAANSTLGQILTYQGKPISAVYSCSNGGKTRSSEEAWGTECPYLIAQRDPWNSDTRNGHGVGMSQKGAQTAAMCGKSYKDILAFYYPNTKLTWSTGIIFTHIKLLINKIMAKL